MGIYSTITHVVAAVAVVVALSYTAGQICRRIWQPEVVGQLFAGIVLGPSLLGRFGGGAMRATTSPAIRYPICMRS